MSQSPETALRLQRYEDGWEVINRMIREDLSWGGYERKCFHVACEDGTFANISAASGLDFLDDGRALCITDIDRDGRPDMVLRNRTSPQLRILRNVWPGAGQAIWIRCEGVKSNRGGIGARVTLRTAQGMRIKEVTAGSYFLSQSSGWLCFGLGKEPGEVKGEVRWPGGAVQELGVLAPGKRYRVREGEAPAGEELRERAAAMLSGTVAEPAQGDEKARAAGGEALATWLLEPIPAPEVFTGGVEPAARAQKKVLHFLSIACPACAAEAGEMRLAEKLIARAGGAVLHVVADVAAPRADVEAVIARLGLAAPFVQADAPTLSAFNIVHRHLWNRRRDLAVPTSFLLDEAGNIVKVYRGSAPAEVLAADLVTIPRDPAARMALALPFPGTLHRYSFHRDLLGLGNAFFEAGLFDLARAAFQGSLGRESRDVDSLFNFALASSDSGRLDEAESTYRRVLEIAPGLDDARNNLGTLLGRAGRRDEALKLFQSIVERNPAHAEAVLNYSNALVQDNHAAEAVNVCLAALKHDPESAAFHRQLGYAQYRAGQAEAAIDSHRRALAIDPLDLDARLGLAILLVATGAPAEARKESLEGLVRNPAHAGLLNTLGMAQAALGERAEAMSSLEKSIAADPRFDRPYTNLARVLLEDGKKAEAERVLRKLLEVAPEHPVAREMLEQVR